MNKKNESGIKDLWSLTSNIRPYMYLTASLAAIGAIATIATLLMLALFVQVLASNNYMVLFAGYNIDIQSVLMLLVIFGACGFITTMLSFTVSQYGAIELERRLRERLTDHLSQLPLGFILNTGTGSLKKVMLEDVDKLLVVIIETIPSIGKISVAPLLTVIVLILLDWRLALIAFIVMAVGFVVMSISSKDMKSIQAKYDRSQEKINESIIEFVQAMPMIRTFNTGNYSFKRYQSALDMYKEVSEIRIKQSATVSKLAMILLSSLPTIVGVLVGGVVFYQQGSLTIGTLIAVVFLAAGMVDSFMPLMGVSQLIKDALISCNRIHTVLNESILENRNKNKTPSNNSISFENVNFRYSTRKSNALENINFLAKEGETTALVGPSGSGKSTVTKLIPRFWDVTSGSIKIGDVDIRDMSTEALMNRVTFVFQDVYLFNDTIENNIKLGNPNASEEMIISAAKSAQIHDYIMSMPNGYQSIPGERGAKLSGGQRQRITIARAILRDTPIVILDEATSFADPESEEKIIEAIGHLTKNKTVLTVAHRLSTISDVEQILVFKDGKIIENGNHQKLLNKLGLYHKLWNGSDERGGIRDE